MDANEGTGGCPFECLTRSYQAWCGGMGGSEDSGAVQCGRSWFWLDQWCVS